MTEWMISPQGCVGAVVLTDLSASQQALGRTRMILATTTEGVGCSQVLAAENLARECTTPEEVVAERMSCLFAVEDSFLGRQGGPFFGY